MKKRRGLDVPSRKPQGKRKYFFDEAAPAVWSVATGMKID
jgi:hypothetical protein